MASLLREKSMEKRRPMKDRVLFNIPRPLCEEREASKIKGKENKPAHKNP